MKKFKKGISLVIAIAMVVTTLVVPHTGTVNAGVKVIVGKSLDAEINDTDTVVVKGKAKAKSTNKKIAKIASIDKHDGVSDVHVKGVKVGKTKIKVKVGKSSKKISVIVRPKQVTGQRASLTSSNSAKVTWSKVKGATGYEVYRSNSSSTGYKKVATRKGAGNTSFTNTGLTLGKYYYYKIRAFGKSGIASEELSNAVYVRTWKLFWREEFNGNEVNEDIWSYDKGDGGWGNRELQYYRPENNIVKDGKLTIKTEFEYDTDAEKNVEKSFYSGRMNTKNKFDFKYGYLQFRAKQAKGVGTWTAGWALGVNKVWPNCGEIDVFETTSAKSKTIIPQSLHCKKFNGMAGSSANKHYDSVISTATSAYHTYGVIWTDHNITFTIDGKATGTYDPNDYVTEGRGVDDAALWPYCQNFYLIVNCAIGGVLGGQVDPTYWTPVGDPVNDIQKYEDYLYFDWIRIFK